MFVACAAATAASVSAFAQTETPAGDAGVAKEASGDKVVLSKFEVITTQGKGYVSSNAATGFKTNQELMKIPQAVTVVTQDLIQDIGSTNSSDILQFAGASNFYRGEALAVRGARINNSFVDEVPDNTPYMDNSYIDTYEVIRGPAAVLYMNASLGGAVLKTTKKPLPYERTTVTVKADEYGLYRGELDSTAPLGKLGDVDVAYRLTAAFQGGDSYFKNVVDDRKVVSPVMQFTYKDTTVRVAFDYMDFDHIPNGNNIINPDGTLFTGAGRDEANYASNGMENFKRTAERIALFHSFSPNWEMKLRANHQTFHRLGSVNLISALNWVDETATFIARRNKQDYDNWTMLGDFSGKYDIGPIENQSNFGYSWADELSNSAFWISSAFGNKVRSIYDPQMDSIGLPKLEDYTAPANPGSRSQTYRGNIYYQHTAEVIPSWLTLVGGVTYSNITQYNVSNIAVTPRQEDIIRGTEYLHRYGAVLNLHKDIALYALESTTFSPSSSRDIEGKLLPTQSGKGREVGLKTSFFGGRLSSTVSMFKIELTNVAVNVGINSSGASYFAPVGSTTQQGFDFDLAFSILPGWQVIATGYNGTVKNQNNEYVGNTYGQLYSLFTRYDFQSGPLKGFGVGGGVSRTAHRYVSAAGITFADGSKKSVMEVAPYTPVNLFLSYDYKKAWLFRLNVDNVLDKDYVMGLQSPSTVDPMAPRTFSGSVTYRF